MTHPFNLEKALAGNPIGNGEGLKGKILYYLSGQEYPDILAYYRLGVILEYSQVVSTFAVTGELNSGSPSRKDLVLLPLFHVEGKEVYVGDTLMWTTSKTLFTIKGYDSATGVITFVSNSSQCPISDTHNFSWPKAMIKLGDLDYPEPEKVAPRYKTEYYVPDIGDTTLQDRMLWLDDDFDKRCLERKLVHLTQEGAIAQAKAILAVLKGS